MKRKNYVETKREKQQHERESQSKPGSSTRLSLSGRRKTWRKGDLAVQQQNDVRIARARFFALGEYTTAVFAEASSSTRRKEGWRVVLRAGNFGSGRSTVVCARPCYCLSVPPMPRRSDVDSSSHTPLTCRPVCADCVTVGGTCYRTGDVVVEVSRERAGCVRLCRVASGLKTRAPVKCFAF